MMHLIPLGAVPFRSVSLLCLLLLLLAPVSACPSATDQRPYRIISDDDDAGDDDDSDDDDSADDDDSGAADDDDASSCDTSWLVLSEESVSLQIDLVPIFVVHCFDCHMLVDQGDLSLLAAAAYGELIDVPNTLGYGEAMPRVTAGEPEQSYLMHKTLGCEQTDPVWGFMQSDMPPSLLPGTKSLDETQKSLIYSWIVQGGEDN
jgi:hypothetical protein